MKIGGTISAAGLLVVGLFLPDHTSVALQEDEIHKAPSYPGFAGINPMKNDFIIVGDTQSTSHWEFWRERNDREAKLIIDEITKRETAGTVSSSNRCASGDETFTVVDPFVMRR
jgi:hypothetical protein